MTQSARTLLAASICLAFGTAEIIAQTNIAPFGVPTQSSTRAGSNTQGDVAVVAIDGNTDGIFNNGSVTHTDQASNPSWQVAFDQPRSLESVNVWNRLDGGASIINRLNGYQLRVFNGAAQVFSTTGGSGINPMETINLGGVVGDRVQISLSNSNPLSLAEVEVFSNLQPGDSYTLSGRNIARGGTATQSSTRTGAPKGNQAILAIDGNTNGVFGNLSVTHTNGELTPSWIVDLGSVQNIENVRVSERTDACCNGRLANFTLSVLDDAMATVFSTNVASVDTNKHVAVDFGTQGQFVQIQLNDTGGNRSLELAEVEVFGGELQNIARNPLATATQSSTRIGTGGNVAEVAIDGITDPRFFGEDSVTHTDPERTPTWILDLAFSTEVENIRLFNRGDGVGNRLDDFRLSLLDQSMNEVSGFDVTSPIAEAGSETFFFDGAVGRFVQVEFFDTGVDRVLSLAEVQVFGTVVPEPASVALWSLLGLAVAIGIGVRRRHGAR